MKEERKIGNLNWLIKRKIESGQEFDVVNWRNKNVGITPRHPLTNLYKKGKITKEQFGAAHRYANYFERSLFSNHARSNYGDITTSYSSSSNKSGFIKDSLIETRIKACRKIDEIRKIILKYGGKRRFIEILENVFEKEISINATAAKFGLNHAVLNGRIQEICKIIEQNI